jgi:hypothetical protein
MEREGWRVLRAPASPNLSPKGVRSMKKCFS